MTTTIYHPERVDMDGLMRLRDELVLAEALRSLMPTHFSNTAEKFRHAWPRELAKVRQQFGLARVRTPAGHEDYFQMPLADGTTGFFMRRADDCLQAAIASCAQIPPHLVPDLHLHERLAAGEEAEEIERATDVVLDAWSDQNGLTIRLRPAPPRRGRWIAVVDGDGGDDGDFDDHCLLMNGRSVLFDPFVPVPSMDGFVTEFDVSKIKYGITIERT